MTASRTPAGWKKAEQQGWWAANRWLMLRRTAQVVLLMLFLSGPLWGVWIAKGTLASSLTLDILPLTDPMIALQAVLTGHSVLPAVLWGAAIVFVFYAMVGGRVFCSWVCPVNMVTDLAAWLRPRLGWREGVALPKSIRYGLLGGVLVASVATGVIAWEFVNPVTMLHRGLVYGAIGVGSTAALVTLAIFALDFAIAPRGWCGSLCPVGAFYALVGRKSLIRVSAVARTRCDRCMECFAVCPERQVIADPLWGGKKGIGPVILDSECTNCGRCIDVCPENVFRFVPRWSKAVDDLGAPAMAGSPEQHQQQREIPL